MSEIVEFRGCIEREIYVSPLEDYRMYSFVPREEDKNNVRLSKQYGTLVIGGGLPKLIPNKEYIVYAKYKKTNGREKYEVVNLSGANRDITKEEAVAFLSNIVSPNLTKSILAAYPNFVELIRDGREKEVDLSKISGVGEAKFETLKKKIMESYCLFDLVAELRDFEFTIGQMEKLRKEFATVDQIKKALNTNPYRCLCGIAGIGFKTADEKILTYNKSFINSEYRMQECIFYLLEQNEQDGHTWIGLKELLDGVLSLAPESISHFKTVLCNDNLYLDEKTKRISTMKSRKIEEKVASLLKEILSYNFKLKLDWTKYTTIGENSLTLDQQKILKYVCDYKVTVLSGYGGTGKSFSTQALVNMLSDAGITTMLMSPTGKASKVMANFTNREATTIHRGLKYNPNKREFGYNESNKLPTDVLIVDEATMIDVSLMVNLLKAVNSKRTRIVFVCDSAQIPSVGAGNCITDIINSGVVPVIFLDKVFRYAEGGLSYIATETRSGNYFLSAKEGTQIFGENKDYMFFQSNTENTQQMLINIYTKLLNNGVDLSDTVILTSYNKGELGTYKINALIQDLVNPRGTKDEITYTKDKSEVRLRKGDRVMQVVNEYSPLVIKGELAAVYNGEEGIIEEVILTPNKQDDRVIVNFNNSLVAYNRDSLNKLQLSYCITIHKSQGSSYTNVIALTPPSHTYFLNRNLLYVAFTRSRKKLFHIGSKRTIQQALRKSENLSRRTFLRELLQSS